MIASIDVFYNTGFTTTNIPSSKSILYNNFTARSFSDCAVKQNYMLATIRIASSFDDIDGADYIVLKQPNKSTFYFVNNIVMINDNCAELSLIMDALTTVGLDNIEIISGWCIRKHVTDDSLMSNVLPEPFSPSHDLTLEVTDVLKPNISFSDTGTNKQYNYQAPDSPTNNINPRRDETNLNIVCASFNLLGDFNEAQKYVVQGSESDAVICPKCPKMPKTVGSQNQKSHYTEIKFSVPGTISDFYKIPMTYMFDGSGLNVKENLDSARALGLDNGITASYLIPYNYVLIAQRYDINTDKIYHYLFDYLTSNYGDLDTSIKFKYDVDGYVPMNNKVYALWNIFTIMSTCSGARSEFSADEIYEPKPNEDGTFHVTFYADLSPNGRPYFSPKYYYGTNRNSYSLAIAGMPWQNQPIAYDRLSGNAFDSVNRQIEINKFLTQGYILEAERGNSNINAVYGAGTAMMGMNPAMESIHQADYGFNIYPNDIPLLGKGSAKQPVYSSTLYRNPHYSANRQALLNNSMNVASASANAMKALYDNAARKEQISYSEQNLASEKARMALAFNHYQNYNVPQIAFPRDESLQNYIGNFVIVSRNRLSDNDVKRFDKFLNMYGYSVDEPLSINDFTSRKLYNYVMAKDVNIKTKIKVPLYIRNYICNQLSGGIRLWHVVPDESKYMIKNEVVK